MTSRTNPRSGDEATPSEGRRPLVILDEMETVKDMRVVFFDPFSVPKRDTKGVLTVPGDPGSGQLAGRGESAGNTNSEATDRGRR